MRRSRIQATRAHRSSIWAICRLRGSRTAGNGRRHDRFRLAVEQRVMNVTRFGSAAAYFPDNHFLMRCVRLQGHEAGPSDTLWLGVSTIEPGGHKTLDAS